MFWCICVYDSNRFYFDVCLRLKPVFDLCLRLKPVFDVSVQSGRLCTAGNQFRPRTGGLFRVEGPVAAVVGPLGGPLAVGVVRLVNALVIPVAVSRVGFEEAINIDGRVTRTSRTNPTVWNGGGGGCVGGCGLGGGGCGRTIGSILAETWRGRLGVLALLSQRVEDEVVGYAVVGEEAVSGALKVLVAVTWIRMIV